MLNGILSNSVLSSTEFTLCCSSKPEEGGDFESLTLMCGRLGVEVVGSVE
jgi:hypothetical protein